MVVKEEEVILTVLHSQVAVEEEQDQMVIQLVYLLIQMDLWEPKVEMV
jgi:hypothetical protein